MRLIDADAFEVIKVQGASMDFIDGMQYVLEMIDNAPTVESDNEWISIEDDRKPKNFQDCLCICRLVEEETNEWDYCMVLKWYDYPHCNNGYVNKPHFTDEGLGLFKVVYWRQLPKHPEKK